MGTNRKRTNSPNVAEECSQKSEKVSARLLRQAGSRRTAKLQLARLFLQWKTILGVEETWRIFNTFTEASRPKSLGSGRGVSDYRKDQRLLGFYDQHVERAPNATPSVPRLLAESLNKSQPGLYGNSADAIEKRVRRLLKVRQESVKAKRALEAKFQRLLRKQELD